MLIGPGVIAAVSVALALLIEPVLAPFLELAAPEGVHFELHLFPGFNPLFFLSLGLIALGVVVFLARGWWLKLPIPSPSSGHAVYMSFIHRLNALGDTVLKSQSGKLSHYLAIILGVVGVLIVLPASQYIASAHIDFALNSPDILESALLAVGDRRGRWQHLVQGALTRDAGARRRRLRRRRHLPARAGTGHRDGSDFSRDPRRGDGDHHAQPHQRAPPTACRRRALERGRRSLRRDILISVLVGVGVGAFALAAVANRPTRQSIVADYYLDHAEAEVGVTDVVGAVVTDFRGMDTLFEITVFSMAAMGVLTILFLSTKNGSAGTPMIPRAPSQIATPLTQARRENPAAGRHDHRHRPSGLRR